MITFTSLYAVWILWDYGKTIPPQIDEAASIDGAGTLQAWRFIRLSWIAGREIPDAGRTSKETGQDENV